jgi:hypothetical protein
VIVDEIRELAERIIDDARATQEQKSLARRKLEDLRDANPVKANAIGGDLEALRDMVERRGPRDRGGPNSVAHQAVRWETLTSPLYDTEMRWERRATRQFWFGAAVIPGLVLAIFVLARLLPLEWFTIVLLSELGFLALAYSYIVFRVQQQAAVAEERMAEKRVGLTFLQIVTEQYSGRPEFELLLTQGTQMFLGHHAPSSILLGPEDLAAVKQLVRKTSNVQIATGKKESDRD